MGLLGGMREPDSVRIAGVSAFALGMTLFLFVYALAAYILYRKRTARTLLLSVFLAYLAMFVLAPRIHERYLYPAIAIAIPLVFDSPAMIAVFGTLSATFLFNLAFVKRFNENELFLAPNDPWAGAAALVNLAALVVATIYGLRIASGAAELPAGAVQPAANRGPKLTSTPG